jgi:hypothetical protein
VRSQTGVARFLILDIKILDFKKMNIIGSVNNFGIYKREKRGHVS